MSGENHLDSVGLTCQNAHWSRAFLLGDIHGDLPALLEVFTRLGLIDERGSWTGAEGTLVLLAGDLIDRGGDSTNLVAYLHRLQAEANDAACHVELLLGNHELMASVGDYRYLCPLEGARLASLRIDGHSGPNAIFRGNSVYANWLQQRPMVVRVGETLVVHAGVDLPMADYSISELNQLAGHWVSYFQGVSHTYPSHAEWILDDAGPLWTRAFDRLVTSSDAGMTRNQLSQLLTCFGASQLAVGHCPTVDVDFRIGTCHPLYGKAVINLDTGISYCYQGRLAALELTAQGTREHYFERSCSPDLLAAVRRQCSADINEVVAKHAAEEVAQAAA